jgi:hypothetical protein
MDSQEAERFLDRAKDLLELARTMRSERHRKLLTDAAEKFLKLAMQVLGPEPKP